MFIHQIHHPATAREKAQADPRVRGNVNFGFTGDVNFGFTGETRGLNFQYKSITRVIVIGEKGYHLLQGGYQGDSVISPPGRRLDVVT